MTITMESLRLGPRLGENPPPGACSKSCYYAECLYTTTTDRQWRCKKWDIPLDTIQIYHGGESNQLHNPYGWAYWGSKTDKELVQAVILHGDLSISDLGADVLNYYSTRGQLSFKQRKILIYTLIKCHTTREQHERRLLVEEAKNHDAKRRAAEAVKLHIDKLPEMPTGLFYDEDPNDIPVDNETQLAKYQNRFLDLINGKGVEDID